MLRINLPDIWIIKLMNSYLDYLTMMVVEPVLLSTWGYTPGKWIFGLQVRGRDGGKISWGDAMNRTWLVFAKGEGYGIPIYNLYRNYKSYKACVDCETLPWEESCGYAIKDESGLRCLGFVGAAAGLFGLTVLVALQAQMPRYQGELTAAQYAANVNDAISYHQLRLPDMNDQGGWDNRSKPDHQLMLDENGLVTGVRLEMECTGEEFVSLPVLQEQLAVIALVGGSGNYNCFTWVANGNSLLNQIAEQSTESYTLEAGDMTITQTVEIEGYEKAKGYLIAPMIESGTPSYQMEFTIQQK